MLKIEFPAWKFEARAISGFQFKNLVSGLQNKENYYFNWDDVSVSELRKELNHIVPLKEKLNMAIETTTTVSKRSSTTEILLSSTSKNLAIIITKLMTFVENECNYITYQRAVREGSCSGRIFIHENSIIFVTI